MSFADTLRSHLMEENILLKKEVERLKKELALHTDTAAGLSTDGPYKDLFAELGLVELKPIAPDSVTSGHI